MKMWMWYKGDPWTSSSVSFYTVPCAFLLYLPISCPVILSVVYNHPRYFNTCKLKIWWNSTKIALLTFYYGSLVIYANLSVLLHYLFLSFPYVNIMCIVVKCKSITCKLYHYFFLVRIRLDLKTRAQTHKPSVTKKQLIYLSIYPSINKGILSNACCWWDMVTWGQGCQVFPVSRGSQKLGFLFETQFINV